MATGAGADLVGGRCVGVESENSRMEATTGVYETIREAWLPAVLLRDGGHPLPVSPRRTCKGSAGAFCDLPGQPPSFQWQLQQYSGFRWQRRTRAQHVVG